MSRRRLKQICLDCFYLSLIAVLLWVFLASVQRADGAPGPRTRATKKRVLTKADLVGTWTMYWGHVRSTVKLSASGDYHCDWPGADYVGSWGFKNGTFYITESCRPENPASWSTYSIRLKPGTLTGRVGEIGVELRLEKPK